MKTPAKAKAKPAVTKEIKTVKDETVTTKTNGRRKKLIDRKYPISEAGKYLRKKYHLGRPEKQMDGEKLIALVFDDTEHHTKIIVSNNGEAIVLKINTRNPKPVETFEEIDETIKSIFIE